MTGQDQPLRALWLRASLVFAGAWAFLHSLQFRTPYILGYDGYYHIKFAWLLPSIGFTREFPWAAHSIWATQFADKEIPVPRLPRALRPVRRSGDGAEGRHGVAGRRRLDLVLPRALR